MRKIGAAVVAVLAAVFGLVVWALDAEYIEREDDARY